MVSPGNLDADTGAATLRAAPWRWLRRLFGVSDAARAVIALLQTDPDGWTLDDYVARHAASQINIWIANEAYGIGLWVGDRHSLNLRAKPSGRDRRAIRRAIDKAGIARWEQAATSFLASALSKAEPN